MYSGKGLFTLRKAAEMYNVPKSTLWDQVSGNVSLVLTVDPLDT